jgi:cation transport regulator
MARRSSTNTGRRKTTARKRSNRGRSSAGLSPRTRKAIDTLPTHAQQIYRKAHKNALKQYKSPSKRRGGGRQSREQVAHKVAWSAVKKAGYRKEGSRWEKD